MVQGGRLRREGATWSPGLLTGPRRGRRFVLPQLRIPNQHGPGQIRGRQPRPVRAERQNRREDEVRAAKGEQIAAGPRVAQLHGRAVPRCQAPAVRAEGHGPSFCVRTSSKGSSAPVAASQTVTPPLPDARMRLPSGLSATELPTICSTGTVESCVPPAGSQTGRGFVRVRFVRAAPRIPIAVRVPSPLNATSEDETAPGGRAAGDPKAWGRPTGEGRRAPLPVARNRPSGLKATHVACRQYGFYWQDGEGLSSVSASQTWTAPSLPPETSRRPSGEKATHETAPLFRLCGSACSV